MPVPKSVGTNAPRQLLRDVVYAKMLTAIEDGTLEPGERLSDDELTAWLGVSRTPVREAMARLVTEGLIEMAANRYTRVTQTSAEAFAEAAQFLAGLQRVALDAAEDAPESVRKTARAAAKSAEAGLKAQELAAFRALQDAYGALVEGEGNALFIETERAIRGRVKFHAAAADAGIDWKAQQHASKALAQI